jgi:hypothetical protein
LQTSGCSTTEPNSVRISAPVGHASRQPAFVQCLQTSDMNTQSPKPANGVWYSSATATRSTSWLAKSTGRVSLSPSSTKRTWRHVDAFSSRVWS